MSQGGLTVIVDYGVGNLRSVAKSVSQYIDTWIITEEAGIILSADRLILPGVGAFVAGMNGLKIRGLIEPIKQFARTGKPMLGICLGAQLLFERGEEFGPRPGLGIIKGKVVKLQPTEKNVKVPQIGWNKIAAPAPGKWPEIIFQSPEREPMMYFVHSYIFEPTESQVILATSVYGGQKFCSAVRQGNIYGCQFHPEKSGEAGVTIIRHFVNLQNG